MDKGAKLPEFEKGEITALKKSEISEKNFQGLSTQ